MIQKSGQSLKPDWPRGPEKSAKDMMNGIIGNSMRKSNPVSKKKHVKCEAGRPGRGYKSLFSSCS